jgi:hypothetical protein
MRTDDVLISRFPDSPVSGASASISATDSGVGSGGRVGPWSAGCPLLAPGNSRALTTGTGTSSPFGMFMMLLCSDVFEAFTSEVDEYGGCDPQR